MSEYEHRIFTTQSLNFHNNHILQGCPQISDFYVQQGPHILEIKSMSIAKNGQKPEESTIFRLTVDMTVFIEKVGKMLSVMLKHFPACVD